MVTTVAGPPTGVDANGALVCLLKRTMLCVLGVLPVAVVTGRRCLAALGCAWLSLAQLVLRTVVECVTAV